MGETTSYSPNVSSFILSLRGRDVFLGLANDSQLRAGTALPYQLFRGADAAFKIDQRAVRGV